jgi:hypothetical protein
MPIVEILGPHIVRDSREDLNANFEFLDSSKLDITALQSGAPLYAAPASASGSAYVASLDPALEAYSTGQVVFFRPDVASAAGAITLNLDGLGAKSIKMSDGTADPGAGTLAAGYVYALAYDGTVFRVITAAAAAAGALGDLSDVSTAGATDGQALVFNSGSWAPGTVSAGASALDDLTDVNLGTPSDGDVLTYDSGTGEWQSAAPTGGGGGLANVVEDTTPQLGGNLDLNTFLVGAASAADLTKLSEVTASSAELNHTDGVTSNIQTQLDGKASSSHSHALNDLSDVDTFGATDGQVLVFDDGTSSWGPGTVAGTGDVVGPASSVDGNLAAFNGTSGKLLADSGKAAPSGAIVGTSDTQTLTGKTIDASANTLSNIGAAEVESGLIGDLTEKVTPVSGDFLMIGDSEAAGALKKVQAGNLPGVGGGGAWGDITGTLADQTDLQAALDAKAATVHTHAAADITSGVFHANRLSSGSIGGGVTRTLHWESGTEPTWKLAYQLPVALTPTIVDAWVDIGSAAVNTLYYIGSNNIDITLPGSGVQPGQFFIITVEPGVTGAFLRRNGSYTHHPINWVLADLPLSPGTYLVVWANVVFAGNPGWVVVGLPYNAAKHQQEITLNSPTSSEDRTFFFTKEAITIERMNSVVMGSSPSLTWTVRHSTDRSAAGNEVVTGGSTTTSTTTATEVTTFDDATIPAGSWVWIETTATSGTVDAFSLSIEYRKD